VNFLRFALKPDAVDFSRSREGSHRYGHGIAFPFHVGNVLKQEGLALTLFQTAELPTHQRHKLRIFVDAFLNSDELSPFFQRFEMFSHVFVITFLYHAYSLTRKSLSLTTTLKNFRSLCKLFCQNFVGAGLNPAPT